MTTNINLFQVDYGNRMISFTLKFVDRTDLLIDVNPDLSVVVKAPLDATLEEIKKRVRKRSRWIVKQQNFFEQFQPLQPPRRFISGETHRYLGRHYRLKLIKSDTSVVKLTRGILTVFLSDQDDSIHARKLVTAWYRKRAEQIFAAELEQFQSLILKLDVKTPQLKLRSMKTRWGSCSKSGTILLNPELVKASKSCIRYVLLHEVCHLKVFTHCDQFYQLMDRFMPDWKEEKRKLNLMADLLV